jgi:ABC-2 type transport system permease protein
VEPIARSVGAFVEWFGSVARFLPGAAGDALVGASFYSAFGGGAEPLPWWTGGLVLAGYALVFATIGALTTWRRDVT